MIKVISRYEIGNFVIIGFLFVVLRIIFWSLPIPISYAELRYLSLGEQLGNHLLAYSQVNTSIAPLAAFTYYLFDLLFGESRIAHSIFAMALTLFQAIIFNDIIGKYKLSGNASSLPFLFFCLLSSCVYDFTILSPHLLGFTFILLALSKLFSNYEKFQSIEFIFFIGFYIGLATLFYIPFIFWSVGFLLCLIFFTSINGKHIFLFINGLLLPCLFVYTYYLLTGNSTHLLHFISSYQLGDFVLLQTISASLLFLSPLFIFAILGIVHAGSFDNRTISVKQVSLSLFTLLITSLGVIIFFQKDSFSIFYTELPFLILYLSHFFNERKSWLYSFLFILLLAYGLSTTFLLSYPNYLSKQKAPTVPHPFVTKENPFSNKKVLILGANKSYWKGNTPTTLFFNWDQSKQYFNYIDSPLNAAIVYKEITTYLPEVIIDKNNLLLKAKKRIPQLDLIYKEKNGFYYLKKELIK
ncbi:MAG: hypothetical protein AB8B61_06975 [Cyclobacteriaceae bacterium]